MISGSVVFYKIATTCLLILVGYIGRRMKLLPEISVSVMSKYILFLALPSYFIYHMPSSVSPATLDAYWFYPLLGFALMLVADLFAYAAAALWAAPEERGTFRILVSLPNWVFMALAVCEPMFVISVIIMAMPTAVLCLTVTEVYGGAPRLAARVILWSTVASLATAPLLTVAADRAYDWL